MNMNEQDNEIGIPFITNNSDAVLAFGVILVLIIMIMPLPTIMLDLLLSFNITIALMIILVAMYTYHPLEFSVFPTLLLIATLYRLALNIASTRLILLYGNEGADAAGKVIKSFGNFVVGGNYVVGSIVFLILVVINFVVITKGSGRIAEVAARFTLDAMPGKQMSIDADLNAGLISEDDAKKRRTDIEKQSEFYGAMDGASKFVRGDAIAGIIITFINIIGGLIIGSFQKGMSVADAAQTYTLLTVGDGFPTTVAPIIQYGAIPVFVDVKLETANVDVTQLENAVSSKTKAVILAHTLGNPFDIRAVKNFCSRHNLWLIEDNCDALGSKYLKESCWPDTNDSRSDSSNIKLLKKKTGSFGDIGTSSFYPPHHMTMGEGGAVYTNNELLKKILLSMRDWGRDCWCDSGKDNTCDMRFSQQHGALPFGFDHKYVYSHFGYNFKPTDMQAAIGCAQIDKLHEFIKKRKINFQIYYNGLKELESTFILPQETPYSDPSWFGFILTLRNDVPFSRNDIVSFLENRKIQTRNLFAGNIIKQPCFEPLNEGQDYKICGDLKNTDRIMHNSFWLGVYPGMHPEAIEYVVKSVKMFVRNHAD